MNQQKVEILYAEDNANDRELTLRGFRKINLDNKVYVVEDGEQALDFLFATGKYSGMKINQDLVVILLDLKMPKVSGLEVLKAIRDNHQTAMIPVVMLTSSAQEEDIVKSYQLKANSYIVKPIEFDKFVSAIADLGFYWTALNKSISRES